jgi:hypothetical protein
MKFSKAIYFLVAVLVSAGLVLCAACTGSQGVGIESIADNGDGTFTINLTDGSSFAASDLTGPQGEQGVQGEPGAGIESIADNGDGTFTINFTDGSTYTTSDLTGPSMPVIQSLAVSDLPAPPGGSVTGTVAAQSATGLALTYEWAVSGGWTIESGGNSATVSITAPAAYGASGTATVNVTDSNDMTATGTISLCTERNIAPVVHIIWCSGNPVVTGGTMEVFASASDPNGDILTYEWAVPSGWAIQSGQGTSQVSVLAPNRPLAGGEATLTVSDGVESSATASVYVGTLDGAWGTAGLVETDSGDAINPQVAGDAAGNAVAVWRQHDGTRNNIRANRYEAGTGWGSAVLIETDDSGLAAYPQVVVDGAGNAVAVWSQWDGTRYKVWANRYEAGTGWGSAVLIETDNSGNAGYPQVAVDAAGNAVAVWSQSDGTQTNIWANRFQ